MKWEVKRLGDVVGVKKRINSGSALPYVGMEHISSGTGEFMGELEPVSVKSSTFFFEPGQLLYGRLRPYLNKVLLPEFKGHCSTEVFPIQPSSAIDKKFLFYWFTSDSTVSRIDATCTGARMPRADVHEVLDFEIPVPPLPEQQRIVSKLDAAFASLGAAEANVERNRTNARELFESYLNGVFEGKGWVRSKVGAIGETRTGSTPPTNQRVNYGDFAPFVKPGDFMVDGSIAYRDDGVSEVGFELSRPIPANSVLMVCVGATIGKTGFVDQVVTSNQQINSMTPRAEFFPKFFYYAMTTKRFFDDVIHNSSQATLPIISKSKWENLTVSFPKERNEQKRITDQLDELSVETKRLETTYQQKLLELVALKKSLLGEAFRGEL